MYTKIESTDYITHDCLSGGDYSGLGYLAHVNVRCLEKIAEEDAAAKDHIVTSGMSEWSLQDAVEDADNPPALIIAEGGYGSITAHIHPEWLEGIEVLEGLDNYPIVDDEAVSEREMELEDENWESCLRADLTKMIVDGITNEGKAEQIEQLLDDDELDLREQFTAACDLKNVYPQFEGGGDVYYHGIEEVVSIIRDMTLIEVDDSPQGAAYRAIRDGLMGELSLGVH